MRERGVFVDHATVHRWAIKMLPVLRRISSAQAPRWQELAKVAGYRARAARIGLAVDNFLTVFFFNDFKAQAAKSLES